MIAPVRDPRAVLELRAADIEWTGLTARIFGARDENEPPADPQTEPAAPSEQPTITVAPSARRESIATRLVRVVIESDAELWYDPQRQPETVEPLPAPSEPVDLAVLLTDTMAFIRQYVVMSVEQAVAVTLWVAHTYVIAACDVTPYLNVASATPRAGKTRLFEVLALIVANAWFTAFA